MRVSNACAASSTVEFDKMTYILEYVGVCPEDMRAHEMLIRAGVKCINAGGYFSDMAM